jgi:nitrite reductase/ring-hydroxylating ferredoxin subunit
MPAFIEAGHPNRLAPGKGTTVTIGSSTVALFKVDDVFYTIEAWCLRCGACLTEGSLEDRILACRGCDWRYDVATGSVLGIPALRLHTFQTRVVGGQVIIDDG